MVLEKANPSNRKTREEVADAFWASDPAICHPSGGPTCFGLTIEGKPNPQSFAMARQAHFVEVEVDTETGMVEVIR